MVLKIGTWDRHCGRIVSYGSENQSGVDKLCAFLLAITPLLQHYKGLYENAGFTVLLFVFLMLVIRFLTKIQSGKINRKCFLAVIPLLIYELYTTFIHSISVNRALYGLFMIGVFLCIASGCLNTVFFLKYATAIASLATILLLIQYISYYLLHFAINFEPTGWLLSENSGWANVLSGFVGSSSKMYRPSAFFLEPSHLFLYVFPLLGLYLLTPGMDHWRKRMSIILTAAIVLSTSGMGIAVAIGLWGLYLVFYKKKINRKQILAKLFSPQTIFTIIAFLILMVAAYFIVPVFRNSINRIFVNNSGSTAIEGRVRLASNFIRGISGKAMVFGMPNIAGSLNFNLAGFFATYIKWGLIGVAISYWFYGQGLFKLKKAYFWLSFVIIVISFFTAHTHGTFYMIYFIVLLMEGYYRTSYQPK